MKQYALLIFLMFSGVSLFAQMDIFQPPTASAFSQGGALTAGAEGRMAFYYNPANFGKRDEFTLFSVSVNVFMDQSLTKLLDKLIFSPTSLSDDVLPAALEELGSSLSEVSQWLGDASENELFAAAKGVSDYLKDIDPALAAQFEQLGSGEFDNEQLLRAILAAPIFDEAPDGDSNLTNVIEALSDGIEEAGGKAFDDYNTDWKNDINKTVRNARDILAGGKAQIGVYGNISYTGKITDDGFGLGLGFFTSLNASMNGDNLLAGKARFMNYVTFAGGVSFPIGPVNLGVQVRPTILGYVDINPLDLLSSENPDLASFLTNSYYTGFYLGLDAGLSWDVFDDGFLTLGAVLKDILPLTIQWSGFSNIDTFLASIQNSSDIEGDVPVSDNTALYQIPPLKFNIGAQILLDIDEPGWEWFGQLKISADVHDLFGFIRYIDYNPVFGDVITFGEQYDLLNYIRFGTELQLFGEILNVRAGFGGGFLSAGLGLNLAIFELNAGVGLSDLKANYEGGDLEFRQIGWSVEAVVRL
ncbi:MAG: hypothetical protein ACR2PY_09445 [Salinispira sp.]